MTISRSHSSRPRPPSYDALFAAIATAASPADLAKLRDTAQQFFMGTQRDDLVAAIDHRRGELPDGDALGT